MGSTRFTLSSLWSQSSLPVPDFCPLPPPGLTLGCHPIDACSLAVKHQLLLCDCPQLAARTTDKYNLMWPTLSCTGGGGAASQAKVIGVCLGGRIGLPCAYLERLG